MTEETAVATDRDALRPCPVGTRIQTLIFDREMFTPGQTEIWAKRHGFKHSGLDVKAYTVRVRQESPSDFIEGSMRTITLRAGVKAVIGCPKPSVREEAKEEITENPRPLAPDDPRSEWRSVDWSREMARLRDIKPRPLHKRYGKSPTPEQTALHKEEERVWNAKYRYASQMQKITLERDNAEFRAKHGREPTAADHVHAVPAGTTGGAIEVKDDPSCGCAPQPSPPRSAAYDACLAEGAKLGPIKTPARVYQLVGATMSKQEQETLVVIPLDARYQLRGAPVEVHRGARSSVAVSTQEVLRTVIVSGASNFVMVHCHPSGRCSPSQADRDLTKHVDKACKTVGGECLMLDHVVIGRQEFYSIREDKLYKVK